MPRTVLFLFSGASVRLQVYSASALQSGLSDRIHAKLRFRQRAVVRCIHTVSSIYLFKGQCHKIPEL
jgi:hypothetical protein